MGRRRSTTYKHPLWEFMLLLAADAEKTGLTEAKARELLKTWMPSMAAHLDTVLAEMGETTYIPTETTKATFDALNSEEVAFTRSQIDRALAEAGAQQPGSESKSRKNEDFSTRLRRELGSKRDASGRATVEV